MLGRLAYRLVSALPAQWLRRIGAWQWTGPLPQRLVQAGSRWLRRRDVVIRHGVAAGLRFNAGGANPGYALGTTEPLVQAALERHLKPGDIFYDIGANVGFFTVLGAKLVAPAGRVCAFEPLPGNVVALRHNIALNALERVSVVEAAVGREMGTASLILAEEPTWAKLAAAGTPPAGRALPVRLVSVDALIASGSVPPPTLVKIDVEGAELDVITGMTVTMRRHRPTILCEMHGRNREFAAAMRECGYEVAVLEGAERLEESRWDVHALAQPK
jgi:FkbM family methyltransferase